jgi:hypothetical protein
MREFCGAVPQNVNAYIGLENAVPNIPRVSESDEVLRGLASARVAPPRLEGAVAAYRDALKERTRERVPLDWAMSIGIRGSR